MMQSKQVLIKNLQQAVTLKPLVDAQKFTSIKPSDLGIVENAWIAFDGETIVDIGQGGVDPKYSKFETLDFSDCIALPGLIDAHTHPVFAGIRANEFCMRLEGATYQDIARRGGGIQASVKNTAAASDEQLAQLLRQRMKMSAEHGVTTIEMKSGYGLSIEEELRHLRIIKNVADQSAQTIVATCLALHAVPEHQPSAKAWADLCAEKLLPRVKAEHLADAVDAFIEDGYFSTTDCDHYLKTAKKLGLSIRLHADEFSNAGAAKCAAEFGALSADHLQHTDYEGMKAMAAAGVVAILLPGTSLYTSIPYTDSRPFKSVGCPVALATDFNPGSCPVVTLRLVMTIAGLHCK